MSNVTVIYQKRQATIKTVPTKSLADIRSEACERFSLAPASSYVLKHNSKKLDLSLPLRLTNLGPGAKLDLIRSSPTSSTKPISIVLRTVDPVSQLSGTFPASTSIWGVLRKFEKDERAAGRANVNITERAAPSSLSGSGRLLYQIPAVRVLQRELTGFEELGKSLEEIGCGGRELLVLRFVQTEMPFEEALQKMASLEKEGKEEVGEATTAVAVATTSPAPAESKEDVVMAEADPSPSVEPEPSNTTPEAAELPKAQSPPPAYSGGFAPVQPNITIFHPSSSATLAAAKIDVPESAYDLNIADLRRIKDSYHTSSLPQRLLSDVELAEREALRRQEMEKVDALKIKIRFPDGYTSVQDLDGKSTAEDLYSLIRTTLRHPEQPFVLMVPPREKLPEGKKRLTLDFKLRSGATLHLAWGEDASEKAKKEPALKEEWVKSAQELPKPVEPATPEEEEPTDKGKGKAKDEKKREGGGVKGDVEKKLKGFLRLGKK